MVKKALELVNKTVPITAIAVPVDSVNTLMNAWKDYKTTREVEITRRTQIAADRDVRLAAIQEQAELFKIMVEKTFTERSENFDRFFSMLEDGFAKGSDQQINAALTMIVEQVKVSPMAQASQLISSINDPAVDTIEI